jgi:hypothetical protein
MSSARNAHELRHEPLVCYKLPWLPILLQNSKQILQGNYEVHPTQLKNWRAVALEGLPGLFEKHDSTAELRRAEVYIHENTSPREVRPWVLPHNFIREVNLLKAFPG